MYWWQNRQQLKYRIIEVLFFIVFFYLFPILSTFEYNYIELHRAQFGHDITSTLIYGTFDIAASVAFYKLIQRYLFNRRFLRFVIVLILYLIAFNFYRKGLYFTIGHIAMFPDSMRKEALRYYANNRANFSTVYMLMQFLCLAALAYFIRSSKQETQLHQLKEQQLLSELNYLKAQIHPHFFFNTINNIYSLALKKSNDTAPVVAKLGEMMRYILYEADQKLVPLLNEVQFLTNYVAVEKIRHHDNGRIVFDVQGVTADALIPPLLLLPFIENAFKHGLQEETDGGFVNIVICMAQHELTLEVSNSKPANDRRQTNNGFGLQNVIKRLDILYPGRYELNTMNENDSHQVLLTLKAA